MAKAPVDVGGKKKDTNTKTTTTQTVDVGGRSISVSVPTTANNTQKSGSTSQKSVSTPTVGGRTLSAEQAKSTITPIIKNTIKTVTEKVKSKVDTQPKAPKQVSTQNPVSDSYQRNTQQYQPQYKQEYTKDDVNTLRNDWSNTLVNSPFTNPDVEYTGQNYQEFKADVGQKQKELTTAETNVSINNKLDEALQKDNTLSVKDVATINSEGKTELINYSTELQKASQTDAQLSKEIEDLTRQKSAYSMTPENASIVNELNQRILALKAQRDNNKTLLNDLQNKQNYQSAYLSKYNLDYAKATDNEELLAELARENPYYSEGAQGWFEHRVANAGKIAIDMASGVASIVDISRDLGGDLLAEGMKNQAEQMLANGQINDAQFNNFITGAKKLAEFDATDESTLNYQLRQLSSDIARGIQDGESGISAFIGQGIDSTANFLAQYMLFGDKGSLAMMSTQSGTQKYFENIAKGYDKTTALLNGIATGYISYMTEKIGMDNFGQLLAGTGNEKVMAQVFDAFRKSNGKEWEALARLWLSQGYSEGLEEVVEGNFDWFLDNLTAEIAGGEPIEYDAGDIFYSMAVGGFSGLLMGGYAITDTAHFVVNTKKQYNNLKADVQSANRILNETNSRISELNRLLGQTIAEKTRSELQSDLDSELESKNKLERAINEGMQALNYYDSKTQLPVEFLDELADARPDSAQEKEILAETVRPNVDAVVNENVNKLELTNRINQTATDFLAIKGVDMDASQFTQMSEEERNRTIENSAKLKDACPNADIAYATEYPVQDKNGVMHDLMQDSNALVIKREGNKPKIVVNPKGETSAIVSAVHEIIHTIEGTEEYNDLFNTVFEDGINGEAWKNKFNELINDRYAGFEWGEVNKEVLTVTVTEDMMRDEGAQAFIDHMAKYNTSTAYKLMYKLSEMTGLFRDNSALGRINALLTQALENQDVVYLPNGIAFSKIPSRDQLKEFHADPINALIDGKTLLMPLSRMGKYKWMPDSEGNDSTVFARGTLKGVATGEQATVHSSAHAKVPKSVYDNFDYLIDNPIAVFPSKSSDAQGAYVAILNARDIYGNVIAVSVLPRKKTKKESNYRDADGNTRLNEWTHVVTGIYGKDHFKTIRSKSGSGKLTAEGEKTFQNFFYGTNPDTNEVFGDKLVYPANLSKDEAVRMIKELQLAPLDVMSLDPNISDYLRKSEQIDKMNESNLTDEEYDFDNVKSFREANETPTYANDWNQYHIDRTMKTGHTMLYAVEPFAEGVQVTPSREQAELWANGGQIYQQDSYVSNVMWNDSLTGIYEPVNSEEYVEKVGDKITDLSKMVDAKNTSDEYLTGFINDARIALGKYADDLGDGFTWKKLQKNNGTRAVLDEIERIAKSYPKTVDDSANRADIRNDVEEAYIEKEVKGKTRGKKAIIYIGLPSAGKSTAGARYGKLNLNAIEIDPDIIKELLPEYAEKGGIMASAVHEESSALMKELRELIIEDGYNIVVPMVGDNYEKVSSFLDQLTALGYNIGIVNVDVTLDESLKRMVKRFVSKGRWISPDVLFEAGIKPKQVYEKLKNYKAKGEGGVSFYEQVDNNGKTPVVTERLGNRDAFFETPLGTKVSQELAENGSEEQGTPSTGAVGGTGVRNNDVRGNLENGESKDSFSNAQVSFSKMGKKLDATKQSDIQKATDFVNSQETKDRLGKKYDEIVKNIKTPEDAVFYYNLHQNVENAKPIWDESQRKTTQFLSNILKTKSIPLEIENGKVVQKDYRSMGNIIIDPKAKSGTSAETKVMSKKGKIDDWGKPYSLDSIKDMNRWTVQVGNIDDIPEVIKTLRDSFPNTTLEIKNGLENTVVKPDGTVDSVVTEGDNYGYVGFHITWEENGIRKEIQVTPDFSNKLKSDEYYDTWRRYKDEELKEEGRLEDKKRDVNQSLEMWKSFGEGRLPLVISRTIDSETGRQIKSGAVMRNALTQDLDETSNSAYMSTPLTNSNVGVSSSMTMENPSESFISTPPSSNNIIPNNGGSIQFSRRGGHTTDNSVNTNVDIDEGLARNAQAVEQNGAFDYGMNPAREADIARRTDDGETFQTVRTIANSMHVDDDFARRMQSNTGLGKYVKEVQTDKEVIKKSADYIRQNGFAKSYENIIKSNDLKNANRDMTAGILLMDEMDSLGLRGTPEYEKLVDKIVQMGNSLGLGLRTVSLFKRMSPQGQVITIESEIRRIQEGLTERYGERAPQLDVPRGLLEEYLNPETSGERRDELKAEIAKNIANQIPPTFMEKLNAYRHLSMLFNPRTWVKNRLANEVFGYINEATRALRTVGETIYSQFNKDFEREAGIYNPLSSKDREWHKKFREDYSNNFDKKGDNKYVSAIEAGDVLLNSEFGREVSENRKKFDSKFMNWVVDTNAKMLSDSPSKSKAYAKSMVGWFKAHNVTPETVTPEQMEEARKFAYKECLYATFNSENQLANAIIAFEKYGDRKFGKVGSKVNRIIVESFVPFKRTPLNLMKTGLSYTPLGLVKTVVYDGLVKVRNGDMTANQFINNLAQGMSGTALFFLGALLKSMGVFRTKDDDKDRKKYFDKDNGEQDYSLIFDGFTYTIDWLDPLIVPLAMGAEFSKLTEDKNLSTDDIYTLGTSMIQPIFDTSMMSGITNNLKSYSNDSAGYTTDLGANAITNYASQYIPSVIGAIARTVDDTRRSTTVNKGKLDKFVKSAMSKTPLLSKKLQPYINKSGEEEKNPTLGLEKYGRAGGLVGRAVLNFLSPGYYADKDIDKYDEEMYRLFNDTGKADALPASTTKSITFNKEPINFTEEEYTQWHKDRYATETKYVNAFMDSSSYKSLSDEEKIATIKDIREYAQKVAKKTLLESRGYTYTDDKELAEKHPDKYVYDKQLTNSEGALDKGMKLYEYYDYLNNAGTKQAEKMQYLENSNLSDEQKKYLWEQEGYKTSYEDVYAKVFGKSTNDSSKKKSSSKGSKSSSKKKKAKSVPTSKSASSSRAGGAGISGNRRNLLGNVKQARDIRDNSSFLKAYSKSLGRKNVSYGSSSTTVCPKCHNRVPSGSNVCPVCGTKL